MARPGSAKPPPPRIKKQEAVTEDPTLRYVETTLQI